MTLTTERPMTDEQRIERWRFHRDVQRTFVAHDPEPEPDTLLWVTVFASIALTLGVLTSHLIWSVEEPEPDGPTPCGMRWTDEAKYVPHYDYHDGRGCRP